MVVVRLATVRRVIYPAPSIDDEFVLVSRRGGRINLRPPSPLSCLLKGGERSTRASNIFEGNNAVRRLGRIRVWMKSGIDRRYRHSFAGEPRLGAQSNGCGQDSETTLQMQMIEARPLLFLHTHTYPTNLVIRPGLRGQTVCSISRLAGKDTVAI